MRLSIGGWVENSERTANGLAIISAEVGSSLGVFSSGRAAVPASSLRSAEASASGSLDSSAPDASAWYSRERLIASWTRPAAIGPEDRHQQAANGLRSRSLPPPKNIAKFAS